MTVGGEECVIEEEYLCCTYITYELFSLVFVNFLFQKPSKCLPVFPLVSYG